MGCCSWLMAKTYDWTMRSTEANCLGAWRAGLLKQAHGTTLEIGAGTGSNLPYYPPGVRLLLCEPDRQMRRQLERKLSPQVAANIEITDWSAEQLAIPDQSIDTLVSTLVLCSVGNLPQAVGEINRVLKPGGQLLFIEHVRSAERQTARWQKRLQPLWRRCCGNCHLTRETLEIIKQNGLNLEGVSEEEISGAPTIVRRTFRGRARKPFALAEVFADNFDFDLDAFPNCPDCGSNEVARMLYGKPALSRKILTGLESGKLISAGCVVHGGAPEWHCQKCLTDFGNRQFEPTKTGE